MLPKPDLVTISDAYSALDYSAREILLKEQFEVIFCDVATLVRGGGCRNGDVRQAKFQGELSP